MQKDITAAQVKADIADLTNRLAAMLKVEADHYKRIDSMRASIAADREIIAKLKTTGTPEAMQSLDEVREKVASALTQLRDAQSGPAPGGANCAKYKAIEQHITNLRAQQRIDVDLRRAASGDLSGIAEARAIRQAAEGKRAEAEEAAAVKAWNAEVAARNAQIDG